jgi:sugar phosphate isomerase/epimerase
MPDYSVAEAVETLIKWGYDGVEWRVTNQAPHEGKPGYWSGNRCTISLDELTSVAAEVGKRCREAGLEVNCLGTYIKADQAADVERVFEACNLMGAPAARVGLPPMNDGENMRDFFTRAVDCYGAVEKLAKKAGVRAFIELHHGTAVASASSMYRFVSNFDARCVGVIHDAGNMVHEGFENYRLAFEGEVHVKNASWQKTDEVGPQGQAIWKAGWAELDQGVVNWADVFAALKHVGYDGWLAIEDFSDAQPTEAKLTGALKFLKACEASV